MELKLKETGEILGLRETGKRLRTIIESAVKQEEPVLIDFEGVESVSSSFADELIAKIYIEIGQEKFVNLIRIKNANSFIKTIINSCIRDRLKRV